MCPNGGLATTRYGFSGSGTSRTSALQHRDVRRVPANRRARPAASPGSISTASTEPRRVAASAAVSTPVPAPRSTTRSPRADAGVGDEPRREPFATEKVLTERRATARSHVARARNTVIPDDRPSRDRSPAHQGRAALAHFLYPEPMAEMHDTTEEYLESILAIEEEGVVPMRARLVERLGLSAAAVSETIGRLSDHGFVELHGDRSLHLTDKGRALATTVVRRHRLAERLLVDVIGLEWEKVHREADRWEHAISADVEEKLVRAARRPGDVPARQPDPGIEAPRQRRAHRRARAQRARARSSCGASTNGSRSTTTASACSPPRT